MSQKKKTTITAEQARSLNQTMHYMAVLIMRMFHASGGGFQLPPEEEDLVSTFLDWYCDQFDYTIVDGKFQSRVHEEVN